MLNLNVNAVMKNVHSVAPHMIAKGTGDIVITASVAGHFPVPWEPVYAASKWAITRFTQTMRRQLLKHGIRVNAVAPTCIETPMVQAVADNVARIPLWLADTPMGRIGRPEEVADAVPFLASGAASLMTGAVVPVDAGFTCW